MSQPYKSGRQQNLNLGISSVTESRTVLQTIGKVGIGTTNAQNHSLFVVGSTNITGDVYVGGASTFVGVGTFGNDLYVANQLYVSGVNVSGGATIGQDITTRHLLATGVSTFVGVSTFGNDVYINSDLYVKDDLTVDEINARNISVTSNGSITTLNGTNLTYTTADIDNAFITAGIVTTISGSNLTYTNGNINYIDAQQLRVAGVSTFTNGPVLIGSGTSSGTLNQRLQVTGGGYISSYLGIGFTDPFSNLAIYDSDGAWISLVDPGQSSSTFENNHGTLYIRAEQGSGNSEIIFQTGTSNYEQKPSVSGSNRVKINNQGVLLVNMETSSGVAQQNLQVIGGAYVSGNTGIGLSNATSRLHVQGDELVTGVVTATKFFGEFVGTGLSISGITTLGVTTSTSLFANNLSVSGVSTFVGVGTFNNDLYVGADLYVKDDLTVDEINARNLNITGLTTVGVVSAISINATGIITANSFRPSSGFIQAADGTNSFYIYNGTGNVAFQGTIGASSINNGQGYQAINFTTNTTPTVLIPNGLNVTGITTLASAGGITTTGGDLYVGNDLYVKDDITADQLNISNIVASGLITATSLSVQTNFDVFDSTATFHNNVYINGNLSIGGTATVISAQDLKIFDKEITLGVTTDAFGNDVSTDNTANHGGIAIASTEGYPLVSLKVAGINTMPDTYKQIMWVKRGTTGAGTTDAWLFNYAVGIGSTQVPDQTRLAVGQIHITDNRIESPNANLTNLWGTNLTYTTGNLTTGNIVTGVVTTLSGTNATYTTGNFGTGNINIGVVTSISGTNLNYTGVGTIATLNSTTGSVNTLSGSNLDYTTGNFGTGNIVIGVVTTISGSNATYTTGNFGTGNINVGVVTTISGSNLTYTTGNLTTGNIVTGVVTTISGSNATYTTGNFGTGNINVGVVTTISGSNLTYTTGNFTTGNIVTGVVTTISGSNATYTTGNLTTGNIVTGIVTNISGTNLNYSGVGTITTFGSTTGTITTLSGTNLTYGTGNLTTGNIVTGIVTTIAGTNLTYTTADIDNAFITSGIVTTLSGSDVFYTRGNFGTADIDNAFITAGIVTTIAGTNLTYGTGNLTTGNIVTGIVTTIAGTNLTYTTADIDNAFITAGIVTTIAGTNLTYTTADIDNAFITSGIVTTLTSTNASLTNINSTGITTLGIVAATQLNVSGVSTFAGIATFTTDLYVGNAFSVDGQTELDDVNVSGIATITTIQNTTANITNLNATRLVVSGVSTFQDHIHLGDGDIAYFGTDDDMRIFHDGGAAYIDNDTGILYYRSGQHFFENAAGTETLARFVGDGSVSLYYDNAKKFETLGTGVTVTGTVYAQNFSTGDSGIGINISNNTITGPSSIVIDPAGVGDNTGAVRIKGDFYVDGTQFVVNSTTIDLADYRVGIATTVGTNLLLDGAGIGIGSANIVKTFTYNNAANTLESSVGLGVTVGGDFKTGTDSVLNRTTLGPTVVNSSLTSVGTLTNLNVAGVVTATTFNGQVNAGVGTITTLNGTNVTYTTGNFGTANVVTGVVTTISGSNLTYTTGNLTTGNIVTGVVTTISGSNLTYTTGNLGTANVVTGVVTTISGTNATYTTGNFGTANVVTGVVTTISGSNLFYTNGNFTNLTATNGFVNTGIITNLTSTAATLTNINSSGITTLGIVTATQLYVSGITTTIRLNVGIGGTVINTTTSGRVGINSANPARLLDVNGDINFNGLLFQNGQEFIASNWVKTSAGIHTFANVGIGTTNPIYDLEVLGDVRLRGGIYDNTNNSAGLINQVVVADGSGGWSWQPVTAAGAGTLNGIEIRDDGAVVGTSGSITTLNFASTPTSNIVVTGYAGGNIATITLSNTPTFGTITSSNASLGFATASSLLVSGVSTFNGNLNATNAFFSGNVSIGGTLIYEDVVNVDSIGVITARSDVRVAGNLSVVGVTTLASAGGITTTGGDLYVGDDLFFKGNLYQNGQLFTAGIGIGSTATNPQSGLITPQARIGVGFTDINFVGTGLSVTGYGSTIIVDLGNLGGTTVSISTTPPGISTTAGNLWWDSNNGDLKIYYNDGNSAQWIDANGGSQALAIVSSAAPSGYGITSVGTLWYNTISGVLNVYYDDGISPQWVDANIANYWIGNSAGIHTLSNVGVGTTTPTEKLQVNGQLSIDGNVSYGTTIFTTSSTAQVGIHSALATATYRSVEYTIQATEGTNFHTVKILALHDGSTAYHTEYGSIFNNVGVSTYDVDVSGGKIRLLATPTSASTTNFKVTYNGIKV